MTLVGFLFLVSRVIVRWLEPRVAVGCWYVAEMTILNSMGVCRLLV